MPYVRLLRPQQWVKNVFIFAALIFGRKLDDTHSVWLTCVGFWCLCAASSAVYVINDIKDREEDRLHPRKSKRPIAAGQVGVGGAALLAAVLLVVAVLGSFLLDKAFSVVVVAYLLLQFGYTFAFKHAVILDVIAIGLGFVLRAIAGGILIHVEISPWLILCTFTLCLFMGFSKRRCELNALASVANGGGPHAASHRRTLAVYTPDLLNHMTTLAAGIAIVSFMLYTMDNRVPAPFEKQYLVYTLPIVVYAIFRFAVLVEHGEVDGPTDVVLRDRAFQAALIVWAAAALLIVYKGDQLRRLWMSLTGRAEGS